MGVREHFQNRKIEGWSQLGRKVFKSLEIAWNPWSFAW
jgi:hypothetical protein